MLVSDFLLLKSLKLRNRRVLILVLVDVGLGHRPDDKKVRMSSVLILVLVDVGLGRVCSR